MKKHTIWFHVLVSLLLVCMLTGCGIEPTVTEFTHIDEYTVAATNFTEPVPETAVTESYTKSTTAAASETVTESTKSEDEETISYQTQFHTYEIWNNNIPVFTDDAKQSTDSYEVYSELDELGRCGPAMANIGLDIMPTEERGSIGQVKPTGWHTIKYNNVDGKYLYNRCHLIGYQLTGENANRKNLVTGTRFLNVNGMLPFENLIADYIESTGNHVLYRVTPIFHNQELVCRGILLEAWSVEDNGRGIQFAVYCPNVQPGIEIDYATGDSWENADIVVSEYNNNTSTNWDNSSTDTSTKDIIIDNNSSNTASDSETQTFILNKNSGKFHLTSCHYVDRMKDSNRQEIESTYADMIHNGYSPCKSCLN